MIGLIFVLALISSQLAIGAVIWQINGRPATGLHKQDA